MAARVLVAEDEAPMRERLVQQLGEVWPAASIVAVCDNGLDAWDAYLEHEPDVAFLDIRMPGMTGLDLAARMSGFGTGTAVPPVRIVFVTAYDQYAVDAFDRGAVDYLLKPIERERLVRTVARLEQGAAPPEDLASVLRAVRAAGRGTEYTKRIKASVGRRIQFIEVDDVLYFQSDTKYTRVVYPGGEALIRTPLRELLARLDPEAFWQIHRNAVVNVRAIAAAERVDADRMEVILKGSNDRLAVSRAFLHLFKE
jgi:DNA-binding LytR/AlgR family response regulator